MCTLQCTHGTGSSEIWVLICTCFRQVHSNMLCVCMCVCVCVYDMHVCVHLCVFVCECVFVCKALC